MAVLVIVIAGAAYLRPARTATERPQTTPAIAVDPFKVTNNPVDYAFVSPSMGWAALIIGTSSGTREFRVFRTTDGAKHWQQQLAGTSLYGPGFSPITVQLFGKERGFMTVGRPVQGLYQTSNGGEQWDQIALSFPPPGVDAITFADATHGWMVAYEVSGLTALPQIHTTSDGGQTWHRLPDPPADGGELGFRSSTDAWMGSYDAQRPHTYTSSDRGQTWLRHDLPHVVGSQPNDRYTTRIQLLPGAGTMVSVEAFRCSGGGPFPSPTTSPNPVSEAQCGSIISESFFFTSVDRGVTWRQLPSPPGQVAYQDSIHWWALSANVIFKSSDAGRSWRQVATVAPNVQLSVPYVLDATHAWASVFVMGGYGLAFTNDAGQHWTLAAVPQPG